MSTRRSLLLVGVAGIAVAMNLAACGVTMSPAPTGSSTGEEPNANQTQSQSTTPSPSGTPVTPGQPDWRPAPGDKDVYLTFDDGPSIYTSAVLDILKENDAKATFFQIGKMVRTREATNRQIMAGGHVIGNHTYDHVDLSRLSASKVKWQLTMATRHIGYGLGPCMRPPYGALDAPARRISQQLGLTPVFWNMDTNDWHRASTASIKATLRQVRPGTVILLHDGGGDRSNTVASLREVLPELKARGYTFATVPACRAN